MRVRRLTTVLVTALAVTVLPSTAWAHGIGGRSDLPVPLEYFLVGAGVVLAVSFGALAILWPEPRLQGGPRYRGPGFAVPRWLTGTLQVAGIGALALVVAAGLAGEDTGPNIAPIAVWVVFWLVVPFAAAVIGNVWSAVSPWAALGRVLRFGERRRSIPVGLGVWPAAVAFVAFTWLELVHGSAAQPVVLAAAAIIYTGTMLLSMATFGFDRTIESVDAFAVYHRLLSGIAPLGRAPDGRIRRRGWLRALAVLPQWPGLVAFVVAMIGTVSYDGLSVTPWWDDVSFALVGRAQDSEWFGTIALLSAIGVIGAGYFAASWWAARIAATPGIGARTVARSFAHTLVPIALAYAVAHYFTLIVFEGQQLWAAISDPLGLGWDLFGTASYEVNYTWLSPTAVWYVQVAAIVGGHVVGVVLAHDRALALFPEETAVRSQYAMLALMVALTGLGLTILAAG
jgi:hypothetical protein